MTEAAQSSSSAPLLKDPDGGREGDEVELPITHHGTLKQHKKLLSAMDVDRSGARMVTGSHDYTLALWDFNGMNDSLLPFRFLEPSPGYPVRFLRYSSTGDQLLVGCTGASLKLLDRNGSLLNEFHKGDPYLKDMKNTKGHISSVTWGEWHPTQKNAFLTAGADGTIRQWNTTKKNCDAVAVIKPLKAGMRAPVVNHFKFMEDKGLVVVAANDGSLRCYPDKMPWISPSLEALESGPSEITFLAVADELISTRGLDDTLKLWDIRKLKEPLGLISSLPNLHDETMCIFSPDGRLLLTGTSVKPSSKITNTPSQPGVLHVVDVTTMEPVEQLPMGESSVVTLNWHPHLNQIFCGMGDGTVQVLYNPSLSQKGILQPLNKAARRTTDVVVDTEASLGTVYNPNALPLFRNMEVRPSKKIKLRAGIKAGRLGGVGPSTPVVAQGPGQGGRLGTSVTQAIMKTMIRDTRRDEDPREALLKYAEIAEKDPKFVTPAYAATQPKTLLDEEALRVEAEREKRKLEEEAKSEALLKRLKK